ncbi:hypothetical protein CPB85DRAFT_1280749 [Mucidula mucida]|nr:hypothetical protein CPB85DRAFT_1280749 [Mucidula mucida]
MATLPRASKSPSNIRPQSEFDAGIDDDEDGSHRPARALYDFDGKAEFRELSVEAGDELEDASNEMFTAEFTPAPDLDISSSRFYSRKREREASTSTITPKDSPRSPDTPIMPQHTGDWMFPSFRQSLLGGKSLNRFSSFVTSGAEEFVLKGKATDAVVTESTFNVHEKLPSIQSDDEEEDSGSNRLSVNGQGDADRHFVDATHAWKEKLPPFRVLVHSPSKRTSSLSGAFTIYNVTSLFNAPPTDPDSPPGSPTRITVQRRYSQFVILHTALTRRLPGIALPPLPEKQYAGRFSEDFVEARRGDLERYIGRVVRHPVARYAEIVTIFLSCESDIEWKRLAPQHLVSPAAGPSFYARVFHPAFNLDLEDAEEAVDRFATHTRGVGKGVQGLRNIFGRVRDARIEMSKAERLLSYSLLSLITSKPLASAPTTGIVDEDNHYNPKDAGLMNQDGAWCWRENCQACLKLSKAIQRTSETLQSARRTQLATHEALKSVAHPSSVYEGVISTHRSTLTRYREAMNDGHSDEDMAARCETVLNTTMAEMETYHIQKHEDFSTMAKEHLDGEIAFYEQVLHRLRSARSCFEQPQYDALGMTARQPSIYERELETPRLGAHPLPQPCPHVYDSAPMRPVSVAIQEGVAPERCIIHTAKESQWPPPRATWWFRDPGRGGVFLVYFVE